MRAGLGCRVEDGGGAVAVLLVSLCVGVACWGAGEPGLVAHYTFDEGPGGAVKDASGTGNHGTNHGATYVNLGDGRGYALSFDTPDAHVDCGDDASLDLTKAVTIALWYKPRTLVEKCEPGIVGKSTDSFTLALGRKTCWAYFSAPEAGRRTDCRITNVSVGDWMHVAATFDGKSLTIYRDGQPADRANTASATIKSAKDHFYLRRPVVYGDKVEPVQKCMMDDVRVYNRALSQDEIVAHYKRDAANKGKDVAWFDRIRLTAHVYPAASTLLVEADYRGLRPIPEKTRVMLELWDTGGQKRLDKIELPIAPADEEVEYVHTTSVCPMTSVSVADKVEWRVNTDGVAARECEIRAVANDGAGRPLGEPTAVRVTLPGRPAWLKADRGVKVLNNFVTQLLEVTGSAAGTGQRHRFVNPRDGWIWMSSTAVGKVRVTLDGSPAEQAVIAHDGTDPGPREAMRKLPAGPHTVEIHGEGGATLSRLVVRAVPEMIFDSIGYRPAPWVKCYGPYDWDFFERCGTMANHNVLVERSPLKENAARTRAWRKQGKHVVCASFIESRGAKEKPLTAESIYDFVAGRPGFKNADRNGTLMSEFDAFGYPTTAKDHLIFAEVARRLAGDVDLAGKVWHCYGKFMYEAGPSMAFVKALIDNGSKFAEEIYMQEQPTEKGARQYLGSMVRQRMLRYQAALPGCQKGMIATLAYFSIPCETVNVDPNANYKVFMDMQMELLANDPVFSELYGVMWYHSAYASEESLRWGAKLLRHYCIEGKRQRLGTDPYELTHVVNGDFRDGVEGWTLDPAEQGSIAAKYVRGFGGRQGRYPRAAMGDHSLLTRRSAERPNRFSQRITGLEPGRLYSVKLLTADFEDISKGLNGKRAHVVSVELDNVERFPEKDIRDVYTRRGGSYAKEDRKQNRWITYRVVYFRTKDKEARLTVSDWASDDDPGGPVGQQLIHNFVEVEPYLED